MKECTFPGCGRVEYLAHGFAEIHTGQARAEGWLLPFDLPKEAA